MGVLLICITTIVLIIQYSLDFYIKTKKQKVTVGLVVLFLAIISAWTTYLVQEKEKRVSESTSQKKENILQQRFTSLDSANLVLRTELNLRNSDIRAIRAQNDSLNLLLHSVDNRQKEFLIITKKSFEEVSRSRTAIENLGLKKVARGISELDKDLMIEALTPYKGGQVRFVSIIGNVESMEMALNLKTIFSRAGWKVEGIDQAIYTAPVKGILINIKDKNYPQRIEGIVKALSVVKIQPIGNINAAMKIGEVEIVAGSIE